MAEIVSIGKVEVALIEIGTCPRLPRLPTSVPRPCGLYTSLPFRSAAASSRIGYPEDKYDAQLNNPYRHRILSGAHDNGLRNGDSIAADLATGRTEPHFNAQYPQQSWFGMGGISPDGKWLGTSSTGDEVYIREIATGKEIAHHGLDSSDNIFDAFFSGGSGFAWLADS